MRRAGSWRRERNRSSASGVRRSRVSIKIKQPPYYYEENVLLTISANGNIQLERTRRELKTKASETWIGNGVYTNPVPGIIKLTFSDNLGQDGAIWHYYVSGDTMIVVDDCDRYPTEIFAHPNRYLLKVAFF